MKPDDPSLIVRYTPNERTNHWVTAILFVLLALSGLALFHPSMFWLTWFFGGGQWTRILHPYMGILMFVSFLLLAIRFWPYNYLDRDDVQWLRQFDDVLAKREHAVPEVGRYNAGQKVVFFVTVACLIVLLVSGVVIWRVYFGTIFPPAVVRFASLVHAITAFVLIVTIIVHIYAAIWVKGSVRAMTRGTVSLGWARKHHAKWFRDIVRGYRDRTGV